MAKRYLIAGATGMLGRDLQAALAGRAVTALDRRQLDVTDPQACVEAVGGHDVVINAAAYTAVDAAEEFEADALSVNAAGAQNLARAARQSNAVLVQVSTDYVFDGRGHEPHAESEPHSPVSAYGRSKAEGERLARQENPDATLVMRTAWLYGQHGQNFVRTMIRLYRQHGRLTVVSDQRGQPTWTRDLAAQILLALDAGVTNGILHGTNSGSATWHEFAQAIVTNIGGDPATVAPVPSEHYPRPAPRPANSVLSHAGWSAHGLTPMRPWRDALDEAMSVIDFGEPSER